MTNIFDFVQNPLEIGDNIIYLKCFNHSASFVNGKIIDIDVNRKEGDTIKIIGDKKNRAGWTYPYRIINKKYILKSKN